VWNVPPGISPFWKGILFVLAIFGWFLFGSILFPGTVFFGPCGQKPFWGIVFFPARVTAFFHCPVPDPPLSFLIWPKLFSPVYPGFFATPPFFFSICPISCPSPSFPLSHPSWPHCRLTTCVLQAPFNLQGQPQMPDNPSLFHFYCITGRPFPVFLMSPFSPSMIPQGPLFPS